MKSEVDEIKLEIYFDESIERKVKKIIEDYHPYDEPNYFIHENNIESREVGSGMIGTRKIKFKALLEDLKNKFNSSQSSTLILLNQKSIK